MSFSYKFSDGAEVEVSALELSSKDMRALRNKDELSIAYDLMESKLSEEELASIESYEVDGDDVDPATGQPTKVAKDRAFAEVMKFFNAWFTQAVDAGK